MKTRQPLVDLLKTWDTETLQSQSAIETEEQIALRQEIKEGSDCGTFWGLSLFQPQLALAKSETFLDAYTTELKAHWRSSKFSTKA